MDVSKSIILIDKSEGSYSIYTNVVLIIYFISNLQNSRIIQFKINYIYINIIELKLLLYNSCYCPL